MIENEVTLKRYFRDKAQVRLEPANEMAEPEYAVVVEGKMMYAVGR